LQRLVGMTSPLRTPNALAKTPRVIALLFASLCLTGCTKVDAARFELTVLLGFAFLAFGLQVVATGPAVFRVSIRNTWRAVAFAVGLLAAFAHATLLVMGTTIVQDLPLDLRDDVRNLYLLLLWPGVFHVALPARVVETRGSTEHDGLVGVRRPQWSILLGGLYVAVVGYFAYHLFYTGQFG
jgi:hypothetical protein